MQLERGTSDATRGVNGTRVIATVLGLCVGISGLDHGWFETLQGNTPTPGLLIQAIGPDQRMWIYGTEEALTVVPNFLVTGILSMLLGLLVIAWSIAFIDRPNGSRVLLLLGLLMLLVGGGIGMLPFLLLGWAVARRIQRPIIRLGAGLPVALGSILARAWPALAVAALALYGFALEIAIVGVVPGVADPDQALVVCWSALLAMLPVLGLAVAGASAGQTLGHRAPDGAGERRPVARASAAR